MSNARGGIMPIIILGILFFIFGFVTWLNGPLIPFLRIACELNDFQASFVPFAFYVSYFVMALPSSVVLRRTGMKNGMVLGLLLMAAGAFGFIPAAETRSAGLFLFNLFVIGTGLALLQTASNPYITVVGPIESAAKRISIMGICNKVGGILAPLVLGSLILVNADQLKLDLASLVGPAREALLQERAALVVMPYIVLGLSLLVAALFIRFAPLPPLQEESASAPKGEGSVFKYPQLMLGVLALFVYVWAEVLSGDSMPVYAERLGTPLDVAKQLTSLTLVAMLVGYLLGIAFIPKYIDQAKALMLSAIAGSLITAGIALVDPTTTATAFVFDDHLDFRSVQLPVSVILVALLGLANAMMWPTIWPLAVDGIGSALKTGSALLIMAILGGALAMPVWAAMAHDGSIASSQNAYLLLLPFYLFIGWYAVKGHRLRSW
ncbi:MAG: sugar MFS transporter [Flavobacteriales bacterium]|nr:sugar MFS transporter [Flavobacteriales bacterium]